MKIRIAKKILFGASSYSRRCRQLRPTETLPNGNVYMPSWSDIDRIRRARTRFMQWYKKDH